MDSSPRFGVEQDEDDIIDTAVKTGNFKTLTKIISMLGLTDVMKVMRNYMR